MCTEYYRSEDPMKMSWSSSLFDKILQILYGGKLQKI
jgi:hypothetical protein